MATFVRGQLAQGQVKVETDTPELFKGQRQVVRTDIETFTQQAANQADTALWGEEQTTTIPGVISAEEIKGLNEQGIHIYKIKTLRRYLADLNLLGKDWASGIPKLTDPRGKYNNARGSFQNSYYVITDTQFDPSTMSSPGLLIFIDRDINTHLDMGKTIMRNLSQSLQKGTLPATTGAIKQAIQPLQAAQVSAGLGSGKGRSTTTDNKVLSAALGSISRTGPSTPSGTAGVKPHTGATETTQAKTQAVKPQNFSQAPGAGSGTGTGATKPGNGKPPVAPKKPTKGGRRHKKTRQTRKKSKRRV